MNRFLTILVVAFTLATAHAGATMPSDPGAPVRSFQVGTVAVDEYGVPGKRAIILIPGLLCGAWEWYGQIPQLAVDRDVYVVTLPGFDGRPRQMRGDLMNDALNSISALIERRHLVRPVVIGHSLGGTMAVLYGSEHAAMIGGVIAVEGGYPYAPTAAQRMARLHNDADPFASADARTFKVILTKYMLPNLITSPADVAAVAKLAEKSSPAAAADWMRAALSLDLTPDLANLAVPLYEIVPFDALIDPNSAPPSKSPAQKREIYQAWLAHAPNGHVIMVDESRHFVMYDQPKALNRALQKALGSIGA